MILEWCGEPGLDCILTGFTSSSFSFLTTTSKLHSGFLTGVTGLGEGMHAVTLGSAIITAGFGLESCVGGVDLSSTS